MIKFHQQHNLEGSDLLLSIASIGMGGTFSTTLLHKKYSFQHIGTFFSDYLHAFCCSDGQQLVLNGEVYYNEEKKILNICFISGVHSHNQRDLFKELIDIFDQYKLRRFILVSSVSNQYSNEVELTNQKLHTYEVSNIRDIDYDKLGIKSFVDLVNLQGKKKELEELKYITGSSFACALCKHLNKRNIPYVYLFSYSHALFDPISGLTLFYKMAQFFGWSNENVEFNKFGHNFEELLKKISSEVEIEDKWFALLKE